MKLSATILIALSFCILKINTSHAFQSANEDSLAAIKSKIKANLRSVKAKKPTQLKTIKTADSMVVYGMDKAETHILHVHNSNYIKGLFVQYTYNETEVIFIAVLKRRVKHVEKNKSSSYYFENGKLIYTRDRNIADDIEFLLTEAERFRQQGTLLLKSIHANPVPKI